MVVYPARVRTISGSRSYIYISEFFINIYHIMFYLIDLPTTTLSWSSPPSYVYKKDKINIYWKVLLLYCLQDGIVSHDEWLLMWSECADTIMNKQEFPYWLSAYMSYLFDSADTSGK